MLVRLPPLALAVALATVAPHARARAEPGSRVCATPATAPVAARSAGPLDASDGGRPQARPPGTPTTLYINFDGALLQSGCGNDPTGNCSTLAGLFGGYVGPFAGNEAQKMAILDAVRTRLAPFGVEVTVRRPAPEVEYSMVLYGDLGPQSFAGIAPYIDCEDNYLRDTSFSQGFATSNTGATIVLQEAAHTWGLEHVDSEFDIMNPFNVASTTQTFRDECFPIVANTDLESAPGICNSMHTRFCPAGQQNSYRELAYLFGPPPIDTTAPTLDILSPQDGAVFVAPVPSLPLLARVADDRHPQFYTVRLFVGNDLALEGESASLGDVLTLANLTRPPAGDYDLRVELEDEAGNLASARVAFSVLPEGTELPPGPDPALLETGYDTPAGCRVAGAGAPPVAFGLALLAGWRRRRTRG